MAYSSLIPSLAYNFLRITRNDPLEQSGVSPGHHQLDYFFFFLLKNSLWALFQSKAKIKQKSQDSAFKTEHTLLGNWVASTLWDQVGWPDCAYCSHPQCSSHPPRICIPRPLGCLPSYCSEPRLFHMGTLLSLSTLDAHPLILLPYVPSELPSSPLFFSYASRPVVGKVEVTVILVYKELRDGWCWQGVGDRETSAKTWGVHWVNPLCGKGKPERRVCLWGSGPWLHQRRYFLGRKYPHSDPFQQRWLCLLGALADFLTALEFLKGSEKSYSWTGFLFSFPSCMS